MPWARSRASIAREAGRTTGKPGFSVKKPPLTTIPADPEEALINKVTQDLLHMRCRMGEQATDGAIKDCAAFTKDKYAGGFQTLVRLTGVPFQIYEKQVRGKAEIKYSSLTGRHWRTVLEKIGPIIRSSSGVFSEKRKEEYADLYESLSNIFKFAGQCKREDAEELALQTSLWTQKYVTMGFRVKPYVHFFNIHLPMSVKILGPQDRFSGELVELKNDSVKKTHLRRTNRKDPAMTLRSQLRIEFHKMKDKEEKFLEERTKKRKAREQHPSVAEGNRLRQKEKRRSEE